MVAIPDGFLVPTKTDGSISLVDLDGKGPYKLTDDQTGKWFYHRVLWKDMDLDGDLDILTCRAREPVIGFGQCHYKYACRKITCKMNNIAFLLYR